MNADGYAGYARLRRAARWQRTYQLHHFARSSSDEFRQAASVGVAQDDPLWPTRQGRLQRANRIFRICAITIKEMFSVINYKRNPRSQIGDGVGDDVEVLVRLDAERISDVEQPGLAENGDDGSFGFQQ